MNVYSKAVVLRRLPIMIENKILLYPSDSHIFEKSEHFLVFKQIGSRFQRE